MINRKKISWRIEGPFDSSYSLAIVNRELARALRKQNIDVTLLSTEGTGDFKPDKKFLEQNPDIAEMNVLSDFIDQDSASVTSRLLYPPRVKDMSGRINLLHSYAWEETGFPVNWVKDFNLYLTGIACVSSHVKKILRDNGVSIPLAVSGNGVDHWKKVKSSRFSRVNEFNLRDFRFIHVSSCFPRKGPDALLEAWGRAFNDTEDVCLIIKTFPNPHNEIKQQVKNLKENYPQHAPVFVIEDDLSDGELKHLYSMCDVMVAPSYAEGFCLPVAEAFLSGIPSITTNWSGQLDFCNKDNTWLIDFEFAAAKSHFELMTSLWAEVNINKLEEALRIAFSTPKSCRTNMALNGENILLSKFKWKNVVERLLNFQNLLEKDPDMLDMKIGLVSTWNQKCGIATYSENLFRNFKSPYFIFAPTNCEKITEDKTNVIRCWANAPNKDEASLKNLLDNIIKEKITAVVIQWNYGFFAYHNLIELVKCLKNHNIIVVFELHTTQDPPQSPNVSFQNYLPVFELADRVLVHNIDDMNRMKRYGLNENLTIFPHGVVNRNKSIRRFSTIKTIATYGFLLPHKGLEEVVEAIGILNSVGVDIKLRMVNAVYPEQVSFDLAEKIKTRIKELNLENQITLETKFLKDEESMRLLSEADALIFAYHPTSESVSGAVRFAISSGVPTLVTDQTIFEELGDAVWKIKSANPEEIAKSLEEVSKHLSEQSEEYKRKMNFASKWCQHHSFGQLSYRLEGICRGLAYDQKFADLDQY